MKIVYFLLMLITLLNVFSRKSNAGEIPRIWEIQSIDTMKTSRDRARERLNDSSFDETIQKQLKIIKSTGANYVAINTPYDNEFLPYLKKWVNFARSENLHVWFRGNWSSWEGWFGYQKNMKPDEHLSKTVEFIKDNQELFRDGDIFEACPECENAGHWDNPEKHKEHNDFLQMQKKLNTEAFKKIKKNVYTNISSMSGGRARTILNGKTLESLESLVSIDHYVKNRENMIDYLSYFADKFNSKIVVSEFGAPIPDINGSMTEDQQAKFVDSIFKELYKKRVNVKGINYFVIYEGTTSLLNDDYSFRKVFSVVQNYYSPSIIKGRIINTLGDGVEQISVESSTGGKTITDENGYYNLPVPSKSFLIKIISKDYKSKSEYIDIAKTGSEITQNFSVEPIYPSILYNIRLYLKNIIKS